MSAPRHFLPLLLLTALSSPVAGAELVVVVNAESGVNTLSRDEVINIFLGRYRQFPTGAAAHPIDQPTAQPEKALFYRLLVNKNLAEINAYWARLMFSGKTSPPRQAATAHEVIDWVSSHKEAIGYIERDQVNNRVKVVMDLPQ